MPRKRGILNISAHLDHAALIAEGFRKYGMVPAVEYELRKFFVVNAAIIRSHDRKRASRRKVRAQTVSDPQTTRSKT